MNIDRLDVQLVAREPAESQDLGLQLLRRHARATYGAVLIVMAPVWALALLLCSASMMGGMLAIWWSKPLIDRVAIHVLSRAVFGAAPTILQTVGAVPSMWDRHLVAQLTWRRFDLRRSLWLPTACLEGLRGRDLKERYGAINYGAVAREGSASTIVFLHIEMALATAGLVLAIWMLPSGWLPDMWSILVGDAPHVGRYEWLSVATWLPGLVLCEVAYTAAGFGMYISRRTELEGWNVELAFQRLGARLAAAARRGVAILLPFVVSAIALYGAPTASGLQELGFEESSGFQESSESQESLGSPGEIAREVLEHPDFDTSKEQTTLVPDFDMGGDGEMGSSLGQFLAQVVKVAGWILAAGILVAVIAYIARNLEVGRVAGTPKKAPKPVEAFGLDLREESLPADIAGAAKELARKGAIVPCLSLLYRGALHRLVQNEELEIFPGDTEHDCMRRLADAGKDRRTDYFGSLTGRWLKAAWGNSPPATSDALELCDGWGVHFNGPRAGEEKRGGGGQA